MSLTTQNFMSMGTDLGGLERFFRGVQALLQVTTSAPALAALAAPQKQLRETKDVLNVTRRFMRLFRFGDSFAGAQRAMAAPPGSRAAALSAEQLLDMLKGTFFGIHGLLESVTALDMAGVDVWGARMDAKLNREALMWWTAALACSILATLMKMVNMKAHEAVNAVDSFGPMAAEKETEKDGAGDAQPDEKAALKRKEKDESKAEAEKQGADESEKEAKKETKKERDDRIALRKATLAERSRQMGILKRKLVADSLDIFIPLSGLMWVAVDPALLGGMMFVTTLMGFLETWGTY